MDDSGFDSYVRKKMENYKAPGYNREAFSQLQARLSDGQAIPWYVKYRVEALVAASLLLFTLFNVYVLFPKFNATKLTETNQTTISDNPTRIIDSLNVIIKKLNSQAPSKVYIIDPAEREESIAADSKSLRTFYKLKLSDSTQNSDVKLFLGDQTDLPLDVLNKLKELNVIALEGNEAWLVVSTQKKDAKNLAVYDRSQKGLELAHKELQPLSITVNLTPPSIPTKPTNEISGKTRNAIEKHYFNGIGINLAPHVDLFGSYFTNGSGKLSPRIGFTADWVLSPQLSVETGLDYATLNFTIKKDFQKLALPNVDSQIGALQSVEISIRTASLPISFKYRRWLTAKSQMVFRVGYTPYFACRHQYVYNYSPLNQPPESDLTISTIEQIDEKKFYANTITASAGLIKSLNNNKKLEASLFFENSVGNVGAENMSMKLFGIKTAYWFNVR